MTMRPDPLVDNRVSPQLADLITEAVVWTDGPAERAEALLQIVSCAVDALCWRLEPDGRPAEEISAHTVVSAAADHLDRMREAD